MLKAAIITAALAATAFLAAKNVTFVHSDGTPTQTPQKWLNRAAFLLTAATIVLLVIIA